MLVRASSGKGVTYQAWNINDVTTDMVNMHEKHLFMDGEKSIAICQEPSSYSIKTEN